ncbi:MAG: hypothetical protein ACR2PS_14415 [Pseudomonadales bacterium]
MDTKYTFISDPGHAWLKVPHADLIKAGVVHDISSCSYMDSAFVYLEEDCDAPCFLEAMALKGRDMPETFEGLTHIRQLPPYTPVYLSAR